MKPVFRTTVISLLIASLGCAPAMAQFSENSSIPGQTAKENESGNNGKKSVKHDK